MTALTALLMAFAVITLMVVVGLAFWLRRRFASGRRTPLERVAGGAVRPPTAREEK
jgi:uncharacterized membrane protein YqjE